MAVSYAEIPELPTLWLWDQRIPRGDVTLLFGEGAVGKGRMLCDLIAKVTTGAPMPLCAEGSDPGSVIVVQPEDDPNEQVAPRLRAAGADLGRVYDLTRLDGGSRFKLSADAKHEGSLPQLRALIDELEESGRNPRMVIIDPLAAVLGWGTITTNQGARRVVEPLQDLAKETGIAIVVVAHTVKSGALQGSAGLPQALRLVYRVSRDKDNPALRVLSVEKANNLGATEDLRYTVVDDEHGTRVVWLDRAEMDRRRTAWRQQDRPAVAAMQDPAVRSEVRAADHMQRGRERAAERLRQARAAMAGPKYAAALTTGWGTNRRTTPLGTFASAEEAQRVCELRPEAAFVPGGLTWRQADERTTVAGTAATAFAVARAAG